MKTESRGKLFDEVEPFRLAWCWLVRVARRVLQKTAEPARPRLLFLDDDPRRAETFLAEHPHAVWVLTAADCVDRLRETWDEVHLDHDLGGRQYVAIDEVDCGMEVIRWMCEEPRDHLRSTRFFVHSHNMVAGLMMVLQMRSSGFNAEYQPFGHDLAKILAHNEREHDAQEQDGDWDEALDRRLSGRRFWRWLARKTGRATTVHGDSFETPEPPRPQPENCQ
jgi:Cyclic-phosphate processing Receiver domain